MLRCKCYLELCASNVCDGLQAAKEAAKREKELAREREIEEAKQRELARLEEEKKKVGLLSGCLVVWLSGCLVVWLC